MEKNTESGCKKSAFKNASVFDNRELYLSYGEKQGESGNFFLLKETCVQKKSGFNERNIFQLKETFQLEETCFQPKETCFQPKETSFKQKETSFQMKETSFQVNETCFQQMDISFKLNETCFQAEIQLKEI